MPAAIRLLVFANVRIWERKSLFQYGKAVYFCNSILLKSQITGGPRLNAAGQLALAAADTLRPFRASSRSSLSSFLFVSYVSNSLLHRRTDSARARWPRARRSAPHKVHSCEMSNECSHYMRSKVDNPGVVNSREMQAEAVPAQPRALWFTPVRVDGVSRPRLLQGLVIDSSSRAADRPSEVHCARLALGIPRAQPPGSPLTQSSAVMCAAGVLPSMQPARSIPTAPDSNIIQLSHSCSNERAHPQ